MRASPSTRPVAEVPLIVVGAGGHGRVVAELAQAAGRVVAGFVDGTRQPGSRIDGLPVLAGEGLLEKEACRRRHAFVVAIGDQAARRRLASLLLAADARLATLAHPRSAVSRRARLGAGTVVVAGAVINTGARLGRFCIVNTGATVDHDARLADGVQICPGANLAGGVACGEDAFVGTGAVLLPGVRIGARAVVGAGAVVLGDVPPGVVVSGNPARRHPARPSLPHGAAAAAAPPATGLAAAGSSDDD